MVSLLTSMHRSYEIWLTIVNLEIWKIHWSVIALSWELLTIMWEEHQTRSKEVAVKKARSSVHWQHANSRWFEVSSVLMLIFDVRKDVTICVTCCNTADLECGLTSNVVFLPSLRSTWLTLMLSWVCTVLVVPWIHKDHHTHYKNKTHVLGCSSISI